MGALHLAAYIRTSPEHCHICSEVRPGDVYVLQIFSYVAHPKRSPERQCSEHIFAEDGQRHRAVVDTYNDFFHYYADQSEYFSQDLQADFEFCLDRYSENEDTIFGRGKTKQLPFMMVKMKTTPQEYQKLSDEIDSYVATNCVMIIEGDTLQASFLSGYKNLLLYFPDEEAASLWNTCTRMATLSTASILSRT